MTQEELNEYEKAKTRDEIEHTSALIQSESRQRNDKRKQFRRNIKQRIFELKHPKLSRLGNYLTSLEKAGLDKAKSAGLKRYNKLMSRHRKKAYKRKRLGYMSEPKRTVSMKFKKKKRWSSDPYGIGKWI